MGFFSPDLVMFVTFLNIIIKVEQRKQALVFCVFQEQERCMNNSLESYRGGNV